MSTPISPDVAQLRRLLARLLDVDPVDVPAAQALADTTALLQAKAALDVLLLRRISDVDRRQLHALDDSPTVGAWLRAQDAPVPADTVATARRLSRFATVDDAVSSGDLPLAAAAKVTAALDKARPHLDRPDGQVDGQDGDVVITAVVLDGVLSLVTEAMGGLADDDPRVLHLHAELSEVTCWPTTQLARLEAGFVLLARHLPGGAPLRPALERLVDALLPQQLEDEAARAQDQRRLVLTPHHDRPGGHVCGDLDAECFELLHTALTASAEADPDNPLDTAGWAALATDRGGPCTRVRSNAQRWHDALRLALRTLLDTAALGQRGKSAPHIAVTVDLAALNADAGALPAVGASGQHLPLSLVRQWWADAHVTRYVLGLGRRVVETSHTERTLKTHERRIKQLETGGQCQGAGCTRGPGTIPGCRLIPHHVDAWARTGTTALDDTAWLCESTHAALHRGATVTLKDGRRLNAAGWVA